MEKIIGIDLGTTHSLCALFQESGPVLIPNSFGRVLTPSLVGLLPSGEIVVGQPALELEVTHPQNCARCFKRLMGVDKKLPLGKHKFSAPELSSMVLKSLKEDARVHTGEEITQAVITVPAYFNEHQRRATQLAGELAGLEVRRIINEPTAAALTYGFHNREGERKLLIFDLGGGTFDVTLMEIFEGTLEIVATAGENFLGGENFTDLLMAWVLGHQGLQLETAEFREPLRVARLRQFCERAKKELSHSEKVSISFADSMGKTDQTRDPVEMDKDQFSELSQDLIKRLSRPLDRALGDGNTAPGEVEDVILVGGATRMTILQDFVRSYFRKEPLCQYNPDEVVALGAAVQTALMADCREVDDMVMTDVCPHTLGIGVVKVFGNQVRDGYFLPVIHRNTTIPVSKEEPVATISPNQRELSVKVYQGESRKVEENLYLGELQVKRLPRSPAGLEVLIRFTYDLNGILEVEAYVPKTGKKHQTLLTHQVKGLPPEEIKKAVKNLKSLKFYPRDDLENKSLLLFCERVIGEINPMERENLDMAIDGFEEAMTLREEEYFQDAKTNLLMVLSRLGYPFEEDQR